jgi:hypothetical protein
MVFKLMSIVKILIINNENNIIIHFVYQTLKKFQILIKRVNEIITLAKIQL